MKTQYWYQGVPVEKIEHVWVKVQEKEDKWFNYECSRGKDVNGYAYLPAIIVSWPLGDFIISNHCGVGINMLRKRSGGVVFKFEDSDIIKTYFKGDKHYLGMHLHFDENCYVETEYYRELWKKS